VEPVLINPTKTAFQLIMDTDLNDIPDSQSQRPAVLPDVCNTQQLPEILGDILSKGEDMDNPSADKNHQPVSDMVAEVNFSCLP